MTTSALLRARDERNSRRWLGLAVFALISVLMWTVALGLALAPRWPSALTLSALTQDQKARVSAPKAADHTVTAVARRALPYSPVDTRTLASARAHEDLLAGKRDPAPDIAPAVDDRPPASLPPPALTASPPVPSTSVPREGPNASRLAVTRLPPVTPPPAARAAPQPQPQPQPQRQPRVDVATRAPTIEPPRRPSVAETPSYEQRTAAPRTAAPPDNGKQARMDLREPRSSPPAERTVTTAAPIDTQRDAVTARLDDQWERRERWFRERLQRR
ncbi:MAG TPA: hypothetical protein VNE58_11220 [Casimicrobiaceae bacterium]|nr:hypothetical protein [Casimicrobiaceae bacterium]